jgi:hypothetical protein
MEEGKAMDKHICQPPYRNLGSMKEFYSATNMLPTSEVADIALIRSHVAYHAGERYAEQAKITASRGHSYRVRLYGDMRDKGVIVRIVDHFDHRDGVRGLFSTKGEKR